MPPPYQKTPPLTHFFLLSSGPFLSHSSPSEHFHPAPLLCWALYSLVTLTSTRCIGFPSCWRFETTDILQLAAAGASTVLTTVAIRWVSSGSSSDPEPNCCNGSHHMKTRTVAIGPVLPPKTRHFNIISFAPIRYLSSDRIVTWSIRKLRSFMRSFTTGSHTCHPTNIL